MKLIRRSLAYPRTPLLFSAVTAGVASCLSMIGGIGIEAVQEKLLPIVPLIVALPALNTMVGDYAAIIAAHAGDPAERRHTKNHLMKAISRAVLVNIIGIIGLSLLVAAHRDYLLSATFVFRFSLFVIGAFASIILFMFVITSLLDKLLEKQRLNPDDILIPVVTTITDVLMLGLIAAAAVFLF